MSDPLSSTREDALRQIIAEMSGSLSVPDWLLSFGASGAITDWRDRLSALLGVEPPEGSQEKEQKTHAR